jgi:hypothetical protein
MATSVAALSRVAILQCSCLTASDIEHFAIKKERNKQIHYGIICRNLNEIEGRVQVKDQIRFYSKLEGFGFSDKFHSGLFDAEGPGIVTSSAPDTSQLNASSSSSHTLL